MSTSPSQEMPLAPASDHDDAPAQPASASNRARQAHSRAGTTHPVSFSDASLERTYNLDRSHGNQAAELRRLHRDDDTPPCGQSDCACRRAADVEVDPPERAT